MYHKIAILLNQSSYLKEKLSFIEELNLKGFEEVGLVDDLSNIFHSVIDNDKTFIGAIVVDCQYQYSVYDIEKIAKEFLSDTERVVFGCNHNSHKGAADKMVDKLMGVSVSDIRTGIYAVPVKYFKNFSEIKGKDIAYNINMFNIIKSEKIDYTCVALDLYEYEKLSFVKTIFAFWLIFKGIITFLISSLASTIVDISLFNVVLFLVKGTMSKKSSILVSSIVARVFSSLFNYTLNRKTVFSSTASVKTSMTRYYILAVVQMLISAGLVTLLTTVLKVENQGLVTVVKMVVDTILFCISYQIQKRWVFKTS